jgi:hypothetical protein
MGNRLINPYVLYMVSFGGALLFYPLHWSGYYPALQNSLILFILISFLLSSLAAMRFTRGGNPPGRSIPATGVGRMALISIFLYILWILEFVSAGGLPAYLILAGKQFDYRTFGIPTLHVFLVTFSSFFACYLFHAFLPSRNKIILLFCVINLLPALLIFNRGMLMMNLSTCLFIYLFFLPSLRPVFSLRKLPLWIITFLVVSYAFGALGIFRVSHDIKQFYSRSLTYEMGAATPSFQHSVIPTEFFWVYLYLTSPIANLQHTIDQGRPEITGKAFVEWGTNEIPPDALSKRINRHFGWTRIANVQIANHLNASTVYARSFAYLGWLGMALLLTVLLGFPFLYRSLLNSESTYYVTGIALLNTLYLFLIFDNMLAFTGMSFQLAYPVVFSWLEKRGLGLFPGRTN